MLIHHIGYLVTEINSAIKEMSILGFSMEGNIFEDFSRGIYIQFMTNGDYLIELIQPIDRESPIYPLLKNIGIPPIIFATRWIISMQKSLS